MTEYNENEPTGNEINENLPNVIEDYQDQQLLAGMQNLPSKFVDMTRGYVDYAVYVILNRAIIGIDGFKPVQRRALYTANTVTKVAKSFAKAARVTTDTMKYHPHGDNPIYQAICRMVEGTEFFQTPFFEGNGTFGKNSKGTSPAHMRYTELRLGKFAKELFSDINGIKMLPTEDGNEKEPELLPITYPSLFANATSGIAVGLSANIFSYLFPELMDYTIEVIEKGHSDTVLVPDFETGGYIVNTPKEFAKIMRTGKGRIKLRGEWYIDKKEIHIVQFPYYTNAPTIKKQVERLELQEVKEVIDASDKQRAKVVVRCKRADQVEMVLNTLVRDTDIQMYANANTVVIVDNQPKVAGVAELIQDWIEFRKRVLDSSYKQRLAYIIDLQKKYRIYLDLTSNIERVNFLVELIKKGGMEAEDQLKKWYTDIDDEIADWILRLSVKNFYNPNKNRESLHKLEIEEKEIRSSLDNLGIVIARQLREIKARYPMERKTQITDVDYTFAKRSDESEPVVPVEVTVKDKFITKRTYLPKQLQSEGSFRCNSDDIILAVDTLGRIIRVDLKRIDYTGGGARGTYLPVFLEVPDDFNLVWATVLEPKRVSFMYSDGKASVLDLTEWVKSKATKRVIPQGISEHASKICGLINLEKDYSLVVTSLGRVGVFENNFKQKGRVSRTSLLRLNENKNERIKRVYGLNTKDLLLVLQNYAHYLNKVTFLENEGVLNEELLNQLG